MNREEMAEALVKAPDERGAPAPVAGERPDWAPAGLPRDRHPAIERMLAIRSGRIPVQRTDSRIGVQPS
jgi:hypothetical protein